MKNTIPLVSVVLPVYNVESYIEECIDSILAQTFKDFETIAIDDCSTDQTISIVEAFNDPRIRVIRKQENKGLIDNSLNIGFEEANGKYIARMDGDDINDLNRFEKQLKILQDYPEIKVSGCWLPQFGKNNEIIKHKEHHKEVQSRLLISNPMSLCASMLERKVYESYRF